jgi:hypothetical protein
MANEKAKKEVNRSEFICTALTKSPDLQLKQINLLWAKAGHIGTISNALYYQVRAKLGIKTERAWVQAGGPETTGSLEPESERTKSPNADLVRAVQDRTEDILDLYEEVEGDRPVIVFDFLRRTICAYHYEQYKSTLSVESQALYDQEYEKALAGDKVLVLVWDRATGRLVITTFDRD